MIVEYKRPNKYFNMPYYKNWTRELYLHIVLYINY